ncbi:MAG TPA: cupredoxin family protein [Noviherbaspirillum sp.]|nr:cupredoxin family protein [Noviherbaspirillum sp.]
MKKTLASMTALVLALAAANSHAGAGHHHKSKEKSALSTDEHVFGVEGDPKKVDRTITIEMTDAMRFSPEDITVKQGETIRFVIKNKGKMLHEMILGTMEELKQHGEMMKKFPGMEHDEPYMTHVRPGKKGQMVWRFTQSGEFYYACLIPGHFEAGMVGKIKVTKG